MNEYFKDAGRFIKKAATLINERMEDDDVIDSSLQLALGMERILKGILYNINPIYIYSNPDFKHTAPLLYKNKFGQGSTKTKEVAKEPEDHVITFRASLLRAKIFSDAIDNHANMLFSLSNARDKIAHRPLSEVDVNKLTSLVKRDLYPLVSACAPEFGHNLDHYLGDHIERLKALSNSIIEEEAFVEGIKTLLEKHRGIWEERKNEKGAARKAYRKTESESGAGFSTVECPACGNKALVAIEADFDYADGQARFMGVFPDHLKCFYCDLELTKYEELDYVDVNKLLNEEASYDLWDLDGEGFSDNKLVMWFRTEYENPAERVPYETREGGYQYVGSEPYNARDVLQDRFPDVDEEEIEEAVEELENDSLEWVKKTDMTEL